MASQPLFQDLRSLTLDGVLLFGARTARMFAYGFLSVVLMLYLAEAGLSETQIGLLLTLTLFGDTIISLWITTHADRLGRRRMLIIGALLMVFALKNGELSILYPFLALSYIWVSLLSTKFLPVPEHMNVMKWIGVFIINSGTGVIRRIVDQNRTVCRELRAGTSEHARRLPYARHTGW